MLSCNPITADMTFGENAAKKVYQLILEENDFSLKLRAYITGGGCSGFQYGFTFDDQVADDDYQIETTITDDNSQEHAITLLIDPMSYQYLKGASIDYREDINGSQFVINNPNAKTTCGCGSSFDVGEEEEEN